MKPAFLLSLLLAAAAGFSFLPQVARGELPVATETYSEPAVEPVVHEGGGETVATRWVRTEAIRRDEAGASGSQPVAARDKKLFERLTAKAGTYVLAGNDEKSPCRFQFGLKQGEKVSLDVTVTQAADEYGHKPGDVNVELRQFVEGINKHARVFDRADFSGINEPATDARLPGRQKITHVTRYSVTNDTLSHTLNHKVTFQGSANAHQRIVFDKDGKGFTYTYHYSNGWKHDLAGRCMFRRQE